MTPTKSQQANMTVYVVVESSWTGSIGYSADGASVFSKKEDAERYKECFDKRFGADAECFITECEVDDFNNDFL